jgi:hypothetical protein
MSIKVKLRQKPISGNRQSLYLDFYPAIPDKKTGTLTRRNFLGLYIFDKPKNKIDQQHNNDTIETAELIRQKLDNQLNKEEIYSLEQNVEISSLKKRIGVQKLYISLLDNTTERGKLIYDSAVSQLEYFQRLLHDKGIPNI